MTSATLTAPTITRLAVHRTRLDWLDGLRAIAAPLVVVQHFGTVALVPGGDWLRQHCDLGIFGVMLFFLVSGYVVPVSLDRSGDVRAFWIGRIFRLYPLLIVLVVVGWLMPDDHSALYPSVFDHTGWNSLANLTLMSEFTGAQRFTSVMWTLSYEMVFYFLITAFFALGARRASTPAALIAAAAAVLGGGVISARVLTGPTWTTATQTLIAAVSAAVIGGLGLVCTGRGRSGAVLLGVTGLAALGLNARAPFFESAVILATMFAGTVIYRTQHGRLDRRTGIAVVLFVPLAAALSGFLFDRGVRTGSSLSPNWQAFVVAYVAAWVTFGVALAVRHRRWPRALTWLGQVSYSVYLVHMVVYFASAWLAAHLLRLPTGAPGRWLVFAVQLTAILVISGWTFRWIERPGQRLGRHLSAMPRRGSAVRAPDPAST